MRLPKPASWERKVALFLALAVLLCVAWWIVLGPGPDTSASGYVPPPKDPNNAPTLTVGQE